jgi:hypothetical protein
MQAQLGYGSSDENLALDMGLNPHYHKTKWFKDMFSTNIYFFLFLYRWQTFKKSNIITIWIHWVTTYYSPAAWFQHQGPWLVAVYWNLKFFLCSTWRSEIIGRFNTQVFYNCIGKMKWYTLQLKRLSWWQLFKENNNTQGQMCMCMVFDLKKASQLACPPEKNVRGTASTLFML